jgi:hypothetical protein
MKRLAIGTLVGMMAGAAAYAQQPPVAPAAPAAPAQARPAPPPAAPAPRWPDGRISFSGSPTDVGNWDGPANASIFFDIRDGKLVKPAPSLATNKTVDEIPFKPGMRKLYDSRWDQAADPHTRCKPSGTHPMASRSSICPRRRKSSSCTLARRTAGAWPTSTGASIPRT